MRRKRAAALTRWAKPREHNQRERNVLDGDAAPDEVRGAPIKRALLRGEVSRSELSKFGNFAPATMPLCAMAHRSAPTKKLCRWRCWNTAYLDNYLLMQRQLGGLCITGRGGRNAVTAAMAAPI